MIENDSLLRELLDEIQKVDGEGNSKERAVIAYLYNEIKNCRTKIITLEHEVQELTVAYLKLEKRTS